MQAILRLAHTWAGHTDEALAVCFHPKGERLASCGADGLVCIWQPGFQQPIQRLAQSGQPTSLFALAFHPHAEALTSASANGRLWLWNTSTGRLADAWEGHVAEVLALAFSSDGRLLASGSADASVLIRDANQGAPLTRLNHPDTVCSLAWSPNGHYLLTGAQDGLARLWNLAGGQPPAVVLQAKGWINALAWSPDGRQVACGLETGQTVLIELPAWQPSRTLSGHRGGVLCVAFSPNSQVLVTGGADGIARLWNLATGRLVASAGEHRQALTGVALAAQAVHQNLYWLATASRDRLVRLWSLTISP
jgi:WD40 repeat protein